ncbi:MAG: LPS export ABC transporter periplasmic protein LptC [Candidatus Binatia bacterium]
MRSRLRLLIGVLLVAILGGGVWLLWRAAAARRAAERAAALVDVMPDVSQRIQHFHRVKIENGRKVWEVEAREAQYREVEGEVTVVEPAVALFLADGREVSLRGARGVVRLEGRELRGVDVEGDITVTLGDYALTTDRATYDRERDLVTAPGRVHIRGSSFEAEGLRMEVEVGAQRLRLAEQVHMTLHPAT